MWGQEVLVFIQYNNNNKWRKISLNWGSNRLYIHRGIVYLFTCTKLVRLSRKTSNSQLAFFSFEFQANSVDLKFTFEHIVLIMTYSTINIITKVATFRISRHITNCKYIHSIYWHDSNAYKHQTRIEKFIVFDYIRHIVWFSRIASICSEQKAYCNILHKAKKQTQMERRNENVRFSDYECKFIVIELIWMYILRASDGFYFCCCFCWKWGIRASSSQCVLFCHTWIYVRVCLCAWVESNITHSVRRQIMSFNSLVLRWEGRRTHLLQFSVFLVKLKSPSPPPSTNILVPTVEYQYNEPNLQCSKIFRFFNREIKFIYSFHGREFLFFSFHSHSNSAHDVFLCHLLLFHTRQIFSSVVAQTLICISQREKI